MMMSSMTGMNPTEKPTRPIDQYGVFQRAISAPATNGDSRKDTRSLTFNNLVERQGNEQEIAMA